MKNITVLFAGFDLESATNNTLEKSFDGKSAAELSLEWALRNGEKVFVLSLPSNSSALSKIIDSMNIDSPSVDEKNLVIEKNSVIEKISVIEEETWTASKIASKITECCEKSEYKTAVYTWIDLPFLNDGLTSRLIEMHIESLSEYSFADGFPYGVAPEVVDSGCAAIISKLSENKNISPSRTALFDVMKEDINSFEIETLVSDVDYRPLRISLECSTKANFVSCNELYKKVRNIDTSNIEEICEIASKEPRVLRNIPHFFDIQITSKVNHNTLYSPENIGIGIDSLSDMKIEDFRNLVQKIASFNPDAVVSLSSFGEPLLHNEFVDFIKELSLARLRILVETDGVCVDDDFVNRVASISGLDKDKIDWIIDIDALDFEFYSKVRGGSESDFSSSINAVSLLSKEFSGHVYPQMTRLLANEDNLEKFFRFWKNPESPSSGKVIIKKFDSLCGKLPDQKPADLSPLKRIPCWHLCRDFVILSDGSVPKCRDCGASFVRGNAFEDNLEDLWEKGFSDYSEHIGSVYNGNCGGCDEYYTFSF